MPTFSWLYFLQTLVAWRNEVWNIRKYTCRLKESLARNRYVSHAVLGAWGKKIWNWGIRMEIALNGKAWNITRVCKNMYFDNAMQLFPKVLKSRPSSFGFLASQSGETFKKLEIQEISYLLRRISFSCRESLINLSTE